MHIATPEPSPETAPLSPSIAHPCNALPLAVADYPMHPVDASVSAADYVSHDLISTQFAGMSVLASVCYILVKESENAVTVLTAGLAG